MQFRQALREACVPVEHRIEAIDIARHVAVRDLVVVGRRHLGFLAVIFVVVDRRLRRREAHRIVCAGITCMRRIQCIALTS